MNEFKIVSVTGYCPYYDDEYTITAKVEKISFAGDRADYARCVSCQCDSSHKCHKGDECPLIVNAQQISRW